MKRKVITVGIAGAGYASTLHCDGYKKVYGTEVRLKAICDLDLERAGKVAASQGIEKVSSDFRALLEDDEIDLIDICTPPYAHSQMIKESLAAGKHVICEKPLTGYFGSSGDPRPIGRKVSKRKMYERLTEELGVLGEVVKTSGRLFMYAENYVYAPAVQKAAEIIRDKKSKILFMKGEESLAGSSSPVAGRWDKTGGGSLIRVGSHPLSGILWLKKQQARAIGEEITIKSLCCDTGTVTSALEASERGNFRTIPEDVEDTATLTLTFSDGSKALIVASDAVLGGTNNFIEIYAHDAALVCRLTPPGCMDTYFLDETGLEGTKIAEMLPTYMGWQHAFVADEILRGYSGEIQDFVECVLEGRKPLSDFDLASETIRIIYAAYWSAEEGRTICL
ncbi:MAG: Putative dehydrogenase [Synergistales bacterium 58_81]|nr:MAG: Putative dehydrogenase [Synergistales bacterium 57_84]KUK88332.1 MAG: Putative dehydrogenase [Synergistales bacterium 58_81]